MSVWSRSHTDLVKLVRTLQETNCRTRRRMQQRKTSVDGGRLLRARSLSPLTKSEPGAVTEKPAFSAEGEGVNAASPVVPQSALGAHGTVLCFEETVKVVPGFSMASSLLQQTEREAVDGLCPPLSPAHQATTSSSTVENLLDKKCSSLGETHETPVPATTNDLRANISARQLTECAPENDMMKANVASHHSLSGTSPSEDVSIDLQDAPTLQHSNIPDVAGTQPRQIPEDADVAHANAAVVEHPTVGHHDGKADTSRLISLAPLVPNLTARSPELLRKLTEVAYSIGAGRRRFHSDGQTPVRGPSSPESAQKSEEACEYGDGWSQPAGVSSHFSLSPFTWSRNVTKSVSENDLQKEQTSCSSGIVSHETPPVLLNSALSCGSYLSCHERGLEIKACARSEVKTLGGNADLVCSSQQETDASLDSSNPERLSTTTMVGLQALCSTASNTSASSQSVTASASRGEAQGTDHKASICPPSTWTGDTSSAGSHTSLSRSSDQRELTVHNVDLQLVPLSATGIAVCTASDEASCLSVRSTMASSVTRTLPNSQLEFPSKHENESKEYLTHQSDTTATEDVCSNIFLVQQACYMCASENVPMKQSTASPDHAFEPSSSEGTSTAISDSSSLQNLLEMQVNVGHCEKGGSSCPNSPTPSRDSGEIVKSPLTVSGRYSQKSLDCLQETGRENEADAGCCHEVSYQQVMTQSAEGRLSSRAGCCSFSDKSCVSSTSGIEGDCGRSPGCTDHLTCSAATCESVEEAAHVSAFTFLPSECVTCSEKSKANVLAAFLNAPGCLSAGCHNTSSSERSQHDSDAQKWKNSRISSSGTHQEKPVISKTDSSLHSWSSSSQTPRDLADVSETPTSAHLFCSLLSEQRRSEGGVCASETCSEKSVASACVQVSFRSECSDPSYVSSRSQKRKRNRDERLDDSDACSVSYSSASSVDSVVSLSETASCLGEVVRYLSSSSRIGREDHSRVSRERLKRFLKFLKHPDGAASLDASRLKEITKTVAEIHELYVSLSRNLEQRQQEQEVKQEELHRELLQTLSQAFVAEHQQSPCAENGPTRPPRTPRDKHAVGDRKPLRRPWPRRHVSLSLATEVVQSPTPLVQQRLPDASDLEADPCKKAGDGSGETGSSGLTPRSTSPQQASGWEADEVKVEPGEEVKERTCAEGKMASSEEAVVQMDEDFDKMLVDMKPHVLKLPQKADRQKCAVWIKKLCEPPSSGITGRKNRNIYAKLMLHMLKRGNIQGPFDRKPEEGPLQCLPSYMSVYFDDGPVRNTDTEKLPDWVEGELAESIGSSIFRRTEDLGNPAATSTWVSHAGSSVPHVRQRPHTSLGINIDKDPGLSPVRGSHHAMGYSAHTDGDLTRQLGVTGISNSTSAISLSKGVFQDDTTFAQPQDKEVALRTKMIEARYHEEKLKLQQKHDAAVQKILDRKNSEIEDVKSHYRSKIKELEEIITKQERKLQAIVKEAALVRDTKDKQIVELKKMLEDTAETRRNEFEKKLHDLEADFEQQKFDLQKLHTRNIQEILDDTNSRLQRMEAEYSQQASSTTAIIKELEGRVQQLTGEVDHTLSQRSLLEKEKAELQNAVEKLSYNSETAQERAGQLERELKKHLDVSEQEMRALRNKTEASLEFLRQEHSIAASKAVDTITDLEQQVDYLKKALKDAEEHRQRQMRETEQVHQQDKLHLENLHDKQVRSMKKELEQLEQEMQRKMGRLEQLLQDKEAEVQKQKEIGRNQLQQAEKTLEEFKLQVEKNQNRICAETKQQIDQVQADLKKSKQIRERQTQDFTRQLEDQKHKYEHEIAELTLNFENEKSQMVHEMHMQKEQTVSQHELDLEELRDAHRNETKSLELRFRERHEKDIKAISDLEAQVSELKEELVQANQLRKQQLVELGLLREEEKQKMQRDHEMELARCRTDAEQQRLELQKMHSSETERLLEKTNERLKSIEREYSERANKSAETMAELHATIKQLRDDTKRVKEIADSKVSEVRNQLEEEKMSLKKQYASNLTMMQHELESQRSRCHNQERQLQKMEAEQEEKITRLKFEHEEKLKGLLPAEMKQELEDTIMSLKSQVNSLQQRAAMLKEELDVRLKNPLGVFGSRTSSPIKFPV